MIYTRLPLGAVLVLLLSACPNAQKEEITNLLMVNEKVVSVQPGKSVVLPIIGGAKIESITPANNRVTATFSSKVITVTGGSNIGVSGITINTSAGSQKVTVKVDDFKTLITDGLSIKFVEMKGYTNYSDGYSAEREKEEKNVEIRWRVKVNEGGSNGYVAFWHPITPGEDGYYPLGTVGLVKKSNDTIGYDIEKKDETYTVYVKEMDDSGALVAPERYEQVWNSAGDGKSLMEGAVWNPVCPTGYVALGHLVTGTFGTGNYGTPKTEDMRCVRKDLTRNTVTVPNSIKDEGNAFYFDSVFFSDSSVRLTAHEIVLPGDEDIPPDNGHIFIKANTFLGVAGGTRSEYKKPVHPAYVLHVKLPVMEDSEVTAKSPQLTSHASPGSTQEVYLLKYLAVPFTYVPDADYKDRLIDRLNDSPIYRLGRRDTYGLQYFFNNKAGLESVTRTETITTGISTASSESFSHSAGISIEATAGVSIKAFEASVTTTLSYEFGYETSSSRESFTEKSVSQKVTVPPGKSGALWNRITSFEVFRFDKDTKTWPRGNARAQAINVESFVKGEYPPN